jgi:quinol monooxygenase YgiN
MMSLNKFSNALLLLLVTLPFIGCTNDKNATAENNTIIVIEYKAQPSKESEAVTSVIKLIENVKKEPNFVSIKLHVDPKDKTNILLYEEWSDENYYVSEHMKTEHLQNFITESRNFLAGPPKITFWKMEKEFE